MKTTVLPTLFAGRALPEYRVRARNGAAASENKIHDDAVARQYGFGGGLVPGVTIYAYMTRPVMDALGLDWLERGAMTVRLVKPFYEGQIVTVRARVTVASAGGASIEVEAVNDEGEACGVGTASLGPVASAAPAVEDFGVAGLPAERPPATLETLSRISVLGTLESTFDAKEVEAGYLEEVADDLAVYRGPKAVASSGQLIRSANTILASNVRLGPWIHVSSEVTHFGLARNGEALQTRGRVTGLFERKGHKFVDLDVLTVAGGTRPIMLVKHTAIYDVRKVQ
jgi:acyl dehydratase